MAGHLPSHHAGPGPGGSPLRGLGEDGGTDAVQHRGQMHHLMSAQKVWVSTDMVSATLDAAGDVPSFEAVDVPAAGLMGLASPLPPVTLQHPLYLRSDEGVTTFTDPVLVDALGWWMDSGRVHVVMCTRTPRCPTRFMRWPPH